MPTPKEAPNPRWKPGEKMEAWFQWETARPIPAPSKNPRLREREAETCPSPADGAPNRARVRAAERNMNHFIVPPI
jgi:hypothetical protein